MNMVELNRTVVDAIASQCSIDLTDYNVSLNRAILGACNRLNDHRVAQGLVASFAGATYWICAELLYRLPSQFKSWSSLYPWMMLISVIGTILTTTAHILNHFDNVPTLGFALEAPGWTFMTSGFALVLCSRLHILVRRKRLIRVCWAIVFANGLICHTLVIVACLYKGPNQPKLLRAGFCIEVLFVLQENGLALLYIYSFVKFVGGWNAEPKARSVLTKLVLAEAVVFCLDAVPLSMIYAQTYVYREAINPFTYAIKLKIEFLILNELVRDSQARQDALVEDFGSPAGRTPCSENRRASSEGCKWIITSNYLTSWTTRRDPRRIV